MATKFEDRLQLPVDAIADFCRRWKVTELALFGSVLRDDFRPDSDVDVLVSFEPEARWDLLDLADMRRDLEEIFGRDVDIVEREALRNPFRRYSILKSAKTIYAAE
jgi:predicted nucleotidyltransferase